MPLWGRRATAMLLVVLAAMGTWSVSRAVTEPRPRPLTAVAAGDGTTSAYAGVGRFAVAADLAGRFHPVGVHPQVVEVALVGTSVRVAVAAPSGVWAVNDDGDWQLSAWPTSLRALVGHLDAREGLTVASSHSPDRLVLVPAGTSAVAGVRTSVGAAGPLDLVVPAGRQVLVWHRELGGDVLVVWAELPAGERPELVAAVDAFVSSLDVTLAPEPAAG